MAKIANKVKTNGNGKPVEQPKVDKPEVEISGDVKRIASEFKDKFGRDPKISLEDIQTMFESEEATRDMDEWLDAVRALENKDSGEAKAPHVVSAQAKEMAAKLTANKDWTAGLAELVEAKDKTKRLPAQLGLYIQQTFNKEERAALPVPSSRMGQTGNQPYDIGKVVGEPSFYQDVLTSIDHPSIVQIFKDIERVRGQKGPGPSADQKMYSQRKNNAVRGLKDGVNVCLRMDEIHSTCKLKCGFRLDPDSEGKQVQRTTVPIWVRPEDDTSGEGVRFLSVGEFLGVKLDVVRNAANDTPAKQMAAFKVERKPRPKKGELKSEPIQIGSANAVVEAIYELATVFTSKDDVAIVDGVFKQLTEAGSDDLLLNMHDVESRLGRWLERPAIKSRLAKLLEDREDEEKEPTKKVA